MKIGKILLAAALMVSGLTASAQETERIEFNHHWFLQLQGGAQYTLGEADFGKLISPNAQLAIGYQFSPVWALRLAVNGWQSKGGFETNDTYKWNYVAPGLDVKFNIINAIAGYTPSVGSASTSSWVLPLTSASTTTRLLTMLLSTTCASSGTAPASFP